LVKRRRDGRLFVDGADALASLDCIEHDLARS
jgi:hypothetical protein